MPLNKETNQTKPNQRKVKNKVFFTSLKGFYNLSFLVSWDCEDGMISIEVILQQLC